jgi:hypothetical protein
MSVFFKQDKVETSLKGYERDDSEDVWDTDPNYVNNVSEKEQRMGSTLIQPTEGMGAINLAELRKETHQAVDVSRQQNLHPSQKHTYGAK